MHEGVENILKSWAKQKRAAFSADFEFIQAQQRVWNILKSELDRDREPQQQAAMVRSISLWKILTPVAVGAVALFIVLVSSSIVVKPLPDAHRVAQQEQGEQGKGAGDTTSEVAVATVGEPQASTMNRESTVQSQPRRRSERAKLYARRDQVVFVAWANSVHTPQQTTRGISSALPSATHVFSF